MAGGPCHWATTGGYTDEHHGDLSEAKGQPAASYASDLSLSAASNDDQPAESDLGV